MLSLVEYTFGREILRSDSARIRKQNYLNKRTTEHHGVWISVKSNNHSRMVDSQVIMQFVIFENRAMKFELLTEKVNGAIAKTGKFEMRDVSC